MNKAEFVADVAERMGDSKMKAEEAVNAVFEAITAALKRGDEVRLPCVRRVRGFRHRRSVRRATRKPAKKCCAGRQARALPPGQGAQGSAELSEICDSGAERAARAAALFICRPRV